MSELIQISKSSKREYWYNHIENWRASKLSQKKYCEQEKINHASFSWWRGKKLKENLQLKAVSFIPAVIKEDIAIYQSTHDIQLILPNQTRLVLPANLPLDNLILIIKSLGGLS